MDIKKQQVLIKLAQAKGGWDKLGYLPSGWIQIIHSNCILYINTINHTMIETHPLQYLVLGDSKQKKFIKKHIRDQYDPKKSKQNYISCWVSTPFPEDGWIKLLHITKNQIIYFNQNKNILTVKHPCRVKKRSANNNKNTHASASTSSPQDKKRTLTHPLPFTSPPKGIFKPPDNNTNRKRNSNKTSTNKFKLNDKPAPIGIDDYIQTDLNKNKNKNNKNNYGKSHKILKRRSNTIKSPSTPPPLLSNSTIKPLKSPHNIKKKRKKDYKSRSRTASNASNASTPPISKRRSKSSFEHNKLATLNETNTTNTTNINKARKPLSRRSKSFKKTDNNKNNNNKKISKKKHILNVIKNKVRSPKTKKHNKNMNLSLSNMSKKHSKKNDNIPSWRQTKSDHIANRRKREPLKNKNINKKINKSKNKNKNKNKNKKKSSPIPQLSLSLHKTSYSNENISDFEQKDNKNKLKLNPPASPNNNSNKYKRESTKKIIKKHNRRTSRNNLRKLDKERKRNKNKNKNKNKQVRFTNDAVKKDIAQEKEKERKKRTKRKYNKSKTPKNINTKLSGNSNFGRKRALSNNFHSGNKLDGTARSPLPSDNDDDDDDKKSTFDVLKLSEKEKQQIKYSLTNFNKQYNLSQLSYKSKISKSVYMYAASKQNNLLFPVHNINNDAGINNGMFNGKNNGKTTGRYNPYIKKKKNQKKQTRSNSLGKTLQKTRKSSNDEDDNDNDNDQKTPASPKYIHRKGYNKTHSPNKRRRNAGLNVNDIAALSSNSKNNINTFVFNDNSLTNNAIKLAPIPIKKLPPSLIQRQSITLCNSPLKLKQSHSGNVDDLDIDIGVGAAAAATATGATLQDDNSNIFVSKSLSDGALNISSSSMFSPIHSSGSGSGNGNYGDDEVSDMDDEDDNKYQEIKSNLSRKDSDDNTSEDEEDKIKLLLSPLDLNIQNGVDNKINYNNNNGVMKGGKHSIGSTTINPDHNKHLNKRRRRYKIDGNAVVNQSEFNNLIDNTAHKSPYAHNKYKRKNSSSYRKRRKHTRSLRHSSYSHSHRNGSRANSISSTSSTASTVSKISDKGSDGEEPGSRSSSISKNSSSDELSSSSGDESSSSTSTITSVSDQSSSEDSDDSDSLSSTDYTIDSNGNKIKFRQHSLHNKYNQRKNKQTIPSNSKQDTYLKSFNPLFKDVKSDKRYNDNNNSMMNMMLLLQQQQTPGISKVEKSKSNNNNSNSNINSEPKGNINQNLNGNPFVNINGILSPTATSQPSNSNNMLWNNTDFKLNNNTNNNNNNNSKFTWNNSNNLMTNWMSNLNNSNSNNMLNISNFNSNTSSFSSGSFTDNMIKSLPSITGGNSNSNSKSVDTMHDKRHSGIASIMLSNSYSYLSGSDNDDGTLSKIV